MSNMSYCRFRNTLLDLTDCYENFHEDEGELSKEERSARRKIVELCIDIVNDFGDDVENL